MQHLKFLLLLLYCIWSLDVDFKCLHQLFSRGFLQPNIPLQDHFQSFDVLFIGFMRILPIALFMK